jgi:hypothetical protein
VRLGEIVERRSLLSLSSHASRLASRGEATLASNGVVENAVFFDASRTDTVPGARRSRGVVMNVAARRSHGVLACNLTTFSTTS